MRSGIGYGGSEEEEEEEKESNEDDNTNFKIFTVSYYSETFVYISLFNPLSYSKRKILLLCLFYKTHGMSISIAPSEGG